MDAIIKNLLIISVLFLTFLISSCSSGNCNNTTNTEFLFTGYNFANNAKLSGPNNYTVAAGQESYGQFTLSSNTNFAIKLYTDNPNIQILQSNTLASPSGSFLPPELQITNNTNESNSYLVIQTESQLSNGSYKLSLFADPVNNSSIESHTYLGYIWVNVTQPIYSTIYISNMNVGKSGVIGCSIAKPRGELINCINYTSESYFNNNLLSPTGIATSGTKLYVLDIQGSAQYPIWECSINTQTTALFGCHGYTAESVGLTINDLHSPKDISISGDKLYISAQNSTPSSSLIYSCNLNQSNDITNCTANNISATGTNYAAPLTANENNVFTLFHPVTTFLNTGTISCNSNVADCSVESSPNTFNPLSSLTGIGLINNNIILAGDNLNTSKNYIGTLRCDTSYASCKTTGPNLATTKLTTAQIGINQGLVFIPLKDLNFLAPASKITTCPILDNGEILTQCIQQDAQTISGLAVPFAVAFYNSF